MTGAEIITAERNRQIVAEKYGNDHDDRHTGDELAIAAACYALPERLQYRVITPRLSQMAMTMVQYLFPFRSKFWKPTPDDRIRELAKAGALIAAEIDRLQRVRESKSNATTNKD